MPKDEHAANPINPAGKPRGAAKKRVYAYLADNEVFGPGPFERDVATDVPSRLRQARLLEREARFRQFVADSNDETWAASNDHLSQFFSDRQQEENETVLTLASMASLVNDRAVSDLRELHAGAMAREGLLYFDALIEAESEFLLTHKRSPLELQPALVREARRVMRRRRKQERDEADAFQNELANLPILSDDAKARTIADWIRNGHKQGLIPPKGTPPREVWDLPQNPESG